MHGSGRRRPATLRGQPPCAPHVVARCGAIPRHRHRGRGRRHVRGRSGRAGLRV